MKRTSFFRLTFLCLVVILGLASGNGCRKPTEQPCPLPPSPPTPCDLSKPPVKQWDKVFGTSSDDVLNISALQQMPDGGYILGGYTNAGIDGDKSQDSRGGYDYWIVKTDAIGNKEWDKRFGGSGDDYLFAIEKTADGGYILGGRSASGVGGDKTSNSQGNNDYWVVKVNANGIKQWDVSFGGSGDDQLRSIQQSTDGGYILGGFSNSGLSGNKTSPNRGEADFWAVKINATGVKQWDATFGGSATDYLYSLRQTADGGYILGGLSTSGISGDKSHPNRGMDDFWAVKISATGTKQWDATFGGNSAEAITSLQQTIDGGYILSGYSFSGISGDKTQDCRGLSDFWVVKITSNGTKQWDARFGGSSDDQAWCGQLTCDGGYILGGLSFSGVGGDKTQASKGLQDYWLVKIDSKGVKQWDVGFGGNAIDTPFAVLQTSDSGFIVGGQSTSNIGGDKTQDSKGGADYWIVKLALK